MYFAKVKIKNEIKFELLIAPAFIIYAIFYLYPFLATFFYSMTDYTDTHIIGLNFVGLKNFITVFNDEQLMGAVKNSIIFAILFTVFQTVFALPLAVFLDRDLKTKNILRLIFFMPAVFSSLIVGFLWNAMMSTSDFGLINNLITSIGLEKVSFLGDSNIALYSVVFTQVWQWTGWAMIIYLANLQGISKEYYEAAMIDGSNSWKSFWKITLPMMYPSVSVVLVISMISGLKVFDIIFSLTQGGPGYATETIMIAMIQKAFNEGFPAVASALGVIFFIIVSLISTFMMRILGKWEGVLE